MNKVYCATVFLIVALPSRGSKFIDDRISGGKIAAKGQFPFYGQLIIQFKNSTVGCGGSLILPSWILSAGNCFFDPQANHTMRRPNWENIKVFMGTNKVFGNEVDVNFVCQVVLHDKYYRADETTSRLIDVRNDVAVAELTKPYSISNNLQLAYLPPPRRYGQERSFMCKVGVIAGTGRTKLPTDTSNNDSFSTRVMFAEVTSIMQDKMSSSVLNSTTKFYSQSLAMKGHPLQGDSGGPYICYYGTNAVVYGIISAISNVSAQGDVLTAYEEVDMHMDFILKTLPEVLNRIYSPELYEYGKHIRKSSVGGIRPLSLFVFVVVLILMQLN